MVLSYYLIKYPYALAWHFKRWLGSTPSVVFYCGTELDPVIFAPVQKYLKPVPVVAANRRLQQALQAQGIDADVLPVFPDGVIMARHAAYKFPVSRIRKICISHGAFNFKRFASAESHNMLDAYCFTSETDVANARAAGITSGVAVGYPKLDRAFDGSINAQTRRALRESLGFTTDKPVLLFTATWNRSGIAAIERWYDRLAEFTRDYQVLVTVHPWTQSHLRERIAATDGVVLIEGYDILDYIDLADVCIGDTSSVIGECCALDKPLITFRVAENERSVPAVMAMIRRISRQVDSTDELLQVLPQVLAEPDALAKERAAANRMMFDELDGKAGQRAAELILRYFPELRPEPGAPS
ncbi:CDP-glycerol glycerophosphotransferase family protein [Granulosicoccaceae sp. 1_MG-2023]|nr:CDP-glycerol glycerophosphotransferase family protein [Granulosicoccaceae sp. 1_MG-2023]